MEQAFAHAADEDVSVITQGAAVATGLQNKFDWGQVAISAVGNRVGQAVGQYGKFASPTTTRIVSGVASDFAAAGVQSAISGRNFGDNLMNYLPSTLGNVAGEAIGDKITGGLPRRVEARKVDQNPAGFVSTEAMNADLQARYGSLFDELSSRDSGYLPSGGQIPGVWYPSNGPTPVANDGTLWAGPPSGQIEVAVLAPAMLAPGTFSSEWPTNTRKPGVDFTMTDDTVRTIDGRYYRPTGSNDFTATGMLASGQATPPAVDVIDVLTGGLLGFGKVAARGLIARPAISAAESAGARSLAAQNVREARNILRDAGLGPQQRNEILRSFDLQTFRVERANSDITAYRLFDDSSAMLQGRYVSTEFFGSQTDRIRNFALMSNSATRLGEVGIPRGSVLFTGRVAPQPSFGPGLTGGANQTFLTGPLSNYTFREIYMPRP